MSLKTNNFKLYKYEDNDIGDLRFINDSMDIIDKGINPFYVATKSSTNVYKVTTGLNKTVLNDGYSIKVAIPSNSSGAVSIKVDSVTVPVKKPNGNAVTNFKQNGVYSLTYYNSVFILASGGETDTVTFTSDKLLTGYSANDSNGEKVNGTMVNLSESSPIQCDSSNPTKVVKADAVFQQKNTDNVERLLLRYAGNGGYIANNTLLGLPIADVAKGINLTADKLLAGSTILGVKGGIPIKGAVTVTLNAGGSYTIPAGYHNGSGKVTATVESLGGIPILYSVTMNGIANGYTFPYTTAPDVNYVVIIMKDNTNSKVYITSRYTTTNYPSYFYTQTTVTNDIYKSDYSISGYMNSGNLKFSGSISSNVTVTMIKFM